MLLTRNVWLNSTKKCKVALTRTLNAKAWDVDGKEYIDFLSMFAVVNMGHSHPKILAAAIKATNEGAIVNLPFHNPYYGKLAKKLHEVGFSSQNHWSNRVALMTMLISRAVVRIR